MEEIKSIRISELRNEDVRVEVLTRICVELGCSLDDIMEIITEE